MALTNFGVFLEEMVGTSSRKHQSNSKTVHAPKHHKRPAGKPGCWVRERKPRASQATTTAQDKHKSHATRSSVRVKTGHNNNAADVDSNSNAPGPAVSPAPPAGDHDDKTEVGIEEQVTAEVENLQLRNDMVLLGKRLAAVERTNQSLSNNVDALHRHATSLERENKQMDGALDTMAAKVHECAKNHGDTTQKQEAGNADPSVFEARVEELDKEIARLREEREKVAQKLKPKSTDQAALTAQSNIRRLEEENKALRSELAVAKDGQTRLISDITELFELIREASNSVPQKILNKAKQLSTKIFRSAEPRK